MQLYLSEKEVLALISTASEWCSMMGDGDEESGAEAMKRLDDGLGSALYKLYKGRNGQRTYAEYARK